MKRVSIFILLALALVACGPKKTKDPAQALAQDFAKLYLAQLDIKEEDWRQLEEDLSQAGQVLRLDSDLEASQEAIQGLPALYDPFKEVMTQEALETMVANGDYPYFPLRETTLDRVVLVSVTRVDPDDNRYDLVFVTKKGDRETRHVLRATIGEKISYLESPSQIFDM
ncbi:hypothetical protein HMPREF1863_01226 [Aedoeadaptatus coxii]|uniref:Uncharacterized protein n=1 Tax=Aedoeadaptatus coxii TaxID=755172 RepID=A0A134ADW0_9FIRM|nr:hypothetical protein [Peptoniphilus coxii]KXB65891.1 hypothetical protein HMPREF1863_01226 [Peptoniphilus coxii]